VSTAIQSILAVAGRVSLQSGYLQTLALLQGLAARGCEVALLCSRMQSEFRARAIPFPAHTWTEVTGHWPSLRSETAILEFVRQRKVQVIHVQGTRLGRSGRRFLRIPIAPVVFTPHSTLTGLREIRWMQRRAARVTAMSEYLREGIVNRARVPREKLVLIPPGVDPDSVEELLPRVNDRVPIVGTVAPLESERGQFDFLEAARMILDSGREAEFVIGGDGPAERALRSRAEALNLGKHLTFATRLADYAHVIRTLDIFVRPTVAGGIGHTVLQAMAMGKPVVVVAAANMLEIVEDNHTGLVVPKKSAAALAASIGLILRDPPLARRMGEAARRRVAERFNLDQLIRNTLRVYAEAVA